MRMRTIREAALELKAEDPATALSEWMLRQLVLQGKVPCVEIGRKRLVDLDKVEQYLSDNCVLLPPPKKEVVGWPL